MEAPLLDAPQVQWALHAPARNATTRAVAWVLAAHAHPTDDGRWQTDGLTHQALQDLTGLSPSSLRAHLRALVEAGALTVVPRGTAVRHGLDYRLELDLNGTGGDA